jgi:hypothetical protein
MHWRRDSFLAGPRVRHQTDSGSRFPYHCYAPGVSASNGPSVHDPIARDLFCAEFFVDLLLAAWCDRWATKSRRYLVDYSPGRRGGSGECHAAHRQTGRSWVLRASLRLSSFGSLEWRRQSSRATSLSTLITIIFGIEGRAAARRSASPLHPRLATSAFHASRHDPVICWRRDAGTPSPGAADIDPF